jgi:hypothetical protein
MNNEELKPVIIKHAVSANGQLELSCEGAHQLAAELQIPVSRIGEICMLHKIKIVHCQLGCFGQRNKC